MGQIANFDLNGEQGDIEGYLILKGENTHRHKGFSNQFSQVLLFEKNNRLGC